MAGDSPQQEGGTAGGLAAGSRLADYRIEAQAGAGGMAVVYRARDERLGRTVALKVLAPALAADAGFRQRFIRESRAAAAVDDPHIIPVYEADQADGVLFIAMRFVSGGDLRSLAAREGPLPAGRAAGFISAAASALDAAHAAGLVHRDVKPSNMLVDTRPGRPDHLYLSDFGLSKGALSSAASLTGSAEVFGTPDYLAPEQASGAQVDGRADQYALGCMAFSLLAGVPLFERDHPMAVVLAHMSAPPPSLTRLRPDLPDQADQVLARALAKAPGGRYPSCSEFAAAQSAQPQGTGPSKAVPPANETAHAQTVTAAPGGLLQPGTTAGQPALEAARPDGHPGTAAVTAPASVPGSAGQPARKLWPGHGRRRAATVALAAVLTAAAVTAAVRLIPGNTDRHSLTASASHQPPTASTTHQSPTANASHQPPTASTTHQSPTASASHHSLASPPIPASRYVVCAVQQGVGTTNSSCEPEAQPRTIYVGSDNTAVNLKWSGWGSPVATARGTSDSSDCNPDCADGHIVRQPTKIIVSDPEPYQDGMAYTRIQTSGGVGDYTMSLSA